MEAGLVVGGKVASTVITKLINGIIDYTKDQKKMQLGLKDELKRLEKALPKIQAVVNAVDQGLIKEENPPLEMWLWQLRDAADDVMDEMEYNYVKEKVEVGESKVSKVVSNLKTFLERAVHKDAFLKRLKEAVKAIDDVASTVGDFYKLVGYLAKKQTKMARSAINNRETSPVLNVETRVFGRKNEEEAIIKKLLNPELKTKDVNFAVLPIIGGGGVGKTTLAQLVYNDPEVAEHFELRMWVCVSSNFDVVLLTKKLYETVFERKADFYSFAVIQTKLKEELESKRFLVVFDDAWNDDDGLGWKKLFAPLKSGKSGSMVLLTTRTETVARLTGPNLMDSVFLKGLNERDMWDLFEECAFGDEDPNNHKKLVKIGKDIVKRLKGYPLAARTVGGALCSDLSEIHWKSILQSELWSLEQGQNDIMPALRLSYEHLQSHLKPCFSFCSIFPQDHVFRKNDLIYMRLALGLVPRDFTGARKPEDVGSKYFEDMLKRSFFSPAHRVSTAYLGYPAYTYCIEKELIGGYIMHDLMHDLSAFVSKGECFIISDANKSVPIPATVRHLYIHSGDSCELNNINLKNIRTLILQFDDSDHPELVCILNKVLKGMRNLRILTLLSLKLSEIPKSICDLLHLRYLSLSSFMLAGFPQSMSRLLLLETIVSGGFGSEKHADVLVKLINLRHIIASDSFVETMAGIGRLTSLQELCFRVGKDSGFKISELGNMRELQRLSISNINDVNNNEESKKANLKNKVGLRELSLQWETKNYEFSLQCETKKFDENVLDHLEPNCNLMELRIRNYMGSRPPVWESGSLSSLVKMEISDCDNLISLDEGFLRHSEKLEALVELTIMNCKELKIPKNGFSKFISLKRLDISGCPKIMIFHVLVFFPPSKLRFLRINSYVDNGVENNSYVRDIIGDLTNESSLCESSLQQAPILQTEDATLLLLDYPVDCPNWEVRLLRMRDYIGRWPPIWLSQTLSVLEYLCIDGKAYLYQYHSNYGIQKLLEFIHADEIVRTYYPSFEIAHPSDMAALEQIYLATQHIKCMQYLKKLTVALCSKSCVLPPFPVTLKELRLHYLGLKVLPNIWENQYSKSGSFPCLVNVEISNCPNLVSLAEGLFQRPEQFEALEKVKIWDCEKLREFPQGGFRKFISLKELDIRLCPQIKGQLVQECFLPCALQVLHVSYCGDLDAILLKALESVHSLISLELNGCQNITSLPPKEVFIRWKTLEKLEIKWCQELASLQSLAGLFSIKQLTIAHCPKLVSAIPSLSAWTEDEIKAIKVDGTTQNPCRPASTQPTSTNPSTSAETKQALVISVDELKIENFSLLSIEPISSISPIRKLTVHNCSKLESLPELPQILEELSLGNCNGVLERSCEKSGADWPKVSHIPRLYLSSRF